MSKKTNKKGRKIKQSQLPYKQSTLSILEIMKDKASNGDVKAKKFVEAIGR